MINHLKLGRIALGRFTLAAALTAPIFATLATIAPPASAASGDVAPNTVIQNTAAATYTDGNNNNYSTNSNTVSTTVQNAPVVVITAAGGTTYSPGSTASDSYTITNNGNAAGDIQFTTIGTGGTDTPATTVSSYVVTLPGGTAQTFTTLTALNTYLAANTIAVTSTATPNAVTLVVNYAIPTTAGTTAGANTYTTTPTVTITQTSGGTAGTTTSAPQNATDTDTVANDARLDLQKSVTSTTATQAGPPVVPGTISYSIAAGDGSLNFKAKDLASAGNLVGAGTSGILITDKLPLFNGAPLVASSAVTTTTSTANGYLGGTVSVYTTTNANGTGGWTKLATGATPPAGTTFVGVYLTGGTGGFELGPDSTTQAGLSAPGTVPNAAITIAFTLQQPTGTGAGNNPVLNLANVAIGSNQATETILAPGVPAGTADSTANSTTLSATGQGINNTTPTTTGTGGVAKDEASNQTSTTIATMAAVLNGPNGSPGASGSYDGVVVNSTANDFTDGVLSVATGTNASTNSGTVAGSPTGSASGAVTTATVTNSLLNNGNANEAYLLTFGTLPAGITVTGVTVNGTALSGSQAAGFTTPVVTSGATINYVVSYAGTAAVPTLTREDVTITATGSTSADTNATHNELYDGFVALTKSQAIVSGCPAGVTVVTGAICPGGTITYTIDYRNIAPALTTGNTEPAAATAATTASALKITEDGTAGGNTWALNTNGLNGTPTDTNAATTFGSYSKNGTAQTTAPNATAFVATVGALNPGASSQITFAVTVK